MLFNLLICLYVFKLIQTSKLPNLPFWNKGRHYLLHSSGFEPAKCKTVPLYVTSFGYTVLRFLKLRNNPSKFRLLWSTFSFRYFTVEVIPEQKPNLQGFHLNSKELAKSILNCIQELHGDFGVAAVTTGFKGLHCFLLHIILTIIIYWTKCAKNMLLIYLT